MIYWHISSEIIQIIVCNNYEGFEHLNFNIFTKKSFQHLKDYLMRKSTLG